MYGVYGVYGVGGMIVFDVGSGEGRLGDGSGDGSDGREGAFGGVHAAGGEVFDLKSVNRDGRGDGCECGPSGRIMPRPGVDGTVYIGE